MATNVPLIVFIVLLVVISGSTSSNLSNLTWLKTGAYVRYDQVFTWNGGNETKSMVWNVTNFNGTNAGVTLTSFTYNVTNGYVLLFPTSVAWVVDAETRLIIKTESGVNVTGYPMPFWIDPNTKVGSTIDAYFGSSATMEKAQPIYALGETRNCTSVTLQWPSATMHRWYDQMTGIVLRIETTMIGAGVQMKVSEDAVESNIRKLGEPSGTVSTYLLFPAVLALVAVAVVVWRWALRPHREQTRTPPSKA